MGIYLPNMEIPETCKLCYLSEFDPGFYAYICKPTGIWIDYDIAKVDRPRTICPLVPIPKHGRLIDADALYKEALERSETKDGYYNCLEPVISCYIIDHAPTVIPAE